MQHMPCNANATKGAQPSSATFVQQAALQHCQLPHGMLFVNDSQALDNAPICAASTLSHHTEGDAGSLHHPPASCRHPHCGWVAHASCWPALLGPGMLRWGVHPLPATDKHRPRRACIKGSYSSSSSRSRGSNRFITAQQQYQPHKQNTCIVSSAGYLRDHNVLLRPPSRARRTTTSMANKFAECAASTDSNQVSRSLPACIMCGGSAVVGPDDIE
jgi:hypothetical protein